MSLPGLRGAEHIGLTVPDLDEAERFLVGVLGATPIFDGGTIDDPDAMTRVLGAPEGSRCRYRFFRLGHGPNLEVFEYRGGRSTEHPGNADAGGHHLALYVDAIGPAYEHLLAHDVACSGPPERIRSGPAAGSDWLYFKAPWGLQMELVSYPNGKGYEAGAGAFLWSPADPAAGVAERPAPSGAAR